MAKVLWIQKYLCPHPKFAAVAEAFLPAHCNICGAGLDLSKYLPNFVSRKRRIVNKELGQQKVKPVRRDKKERSTRASRSTEIRREREKLEAQKARIENRLTVIQDQLCKHPNAYSTVACGNSDDSKDRLCPDCHKPLGAEVN